MRNVDCGGAAITKKNTERKANKMNNAETADIQITDAKMLVKNFNTQEIEEGNLQGMEMEEGNNHEAEREEGNDQQVETEEGRQKRHRGLAR